MAAKKQFKVEKKGLELTWDNIVKYGVLTQAKVDYLIHKASRKIVVGGKLTGKTYPAKVKEVVKFKNELYANTYDFRKYKDSATDKLAGYFQRTLTSLRNFGFDIDPNNFKKSNNKFYHMVNSKRDMIKNPKQEYASLEDTSATDGGAPSNGGYYAMVHIDEPVVMEDMLNPNKIPDQQAWDAKMKVMKSNLNRFNKDFAFVMNQRNKRLAEENGTEFVPIAAPKYEEIFTLNPWGEHPIVLEAERIFPEEEFVREIFSGYSIEELLGNVKLVKELFDSQEFVDKLINTSTVFKYQESTDTLVVRNTVFGNPVECDTPEVIEEKVKAIRKALIKEDYNDLTIILGIKYIPDPDDEMLVFKIPDFRLKKLEAIKKGGWKVERITYSVDVDTSRVFTITPGLLLSRIVRKNMIELEKQQKIFVDTQVELVANGTGQHGEKNDVYISVLVKVIDKLYKKTCNYFNTPPKKSILVVDDKRKIYLNELKKRGLPFIGTYDSFKQHGKLFDIAARQDMTVTGLENDIIWISEKNKALVQDMKICQKSDRDKPQRKTSGKTNYLDRIDSMENAVIPYAGRIWKAKRKAEKR